jgi:mannose-1-phosphate guanylyltransferase
MKALLLAAGLGTRLRPITNRVPKCLVLIHGKPLLEYWLDMLLSNGVTQVLVNTHYMADSVRVFVSDSPWRDSIKMVHEEHLLGTGGTVLKNRDFMNDEPVMVIHADNLSRFNVKEFIYAHESRLSGIEITMMTFNTDTPRSCGIVEVAANGVVIAFHEKVTNPPSNQANAAVYIFEPSVLDFLASLDKTIIDISTEVLPEYLGRIQAFHNSDYHRDIGTLESLRLAQKEFQFNR